MKIFSKELLIEELRAIRDKGWTLSQRKGNHGAIGNTLEDLLGIEENNLPLPNAAEWELKTTNKHANSLITLFHMEPSPRAMRFVPSVLLPFYGWPHKEAGKRYGSEEKSFRQTIRTTLTSDRGFSVYVDYNNLRVEVTFNIDRVDQKHRAWLDGIINSNNKVLEHRPYWGFDDIYHKLGAKLHNCFFILASEKREDGNIYFLYDEIYMLKNLSREKFIQAIEQGLIYIDFDARTGHNHGTKFRIREKDIYNLYEDVIQL